MTRLRSLSLVQLFPIRLFVLFVVAFALSNGCTFADIMTPPGLVPGDRFRVVFVTSTTRDATSANIADYDAFVTSSAIAGNLMVYNGVSVTWQVIGSTPDVTAISRLPLTSSALYLNGGLSLVAASGADLWDGSLVRGIYKDEFNSPNNVGGEVWTGTRFDGIQNRGLGDSSLLANTGNAGSINGTWIDTGSAPTNNLYRFYAVSSELTVTSVPEPSSLAVLLLGSFLAITLQNRRKRKLIPS